MDALILSVGTGGGHNAAGYAVKEELLRRGHNVEMMNPYDLKSSKTSKIIDNTYIKLVQTVPKAFGLVYFIGDAYRKLPWRSPIYFANRRMAEVLKGYLEEHHFDIVIMPHLFPAEMMTRISQSGREHPKTLFITTDYTCIPFIEETELDAYIIPTSQLQSEFESFGVPRERMFSLGIPTLSGYKSGIPKSEAKRALGLSESKRYILITGGSMGSGNLVKIVRYILRWRAECGALDIEPVIVCGSNKKLYEKMEKEFCGDCVVVGYTTKMPLYMKACEIFMTKPGGLSSTEAASAGIPIIHITPIPGCESKNLRYFEEHGMSIFAKCSEKSIKNALDYLEKSENRDKMVSCQKKFLSDKAASDICDLAQRLVVEKEKEKENEKEKELVFCS